MSDKNEHLKSLHTALVDSRIGYEEAVKDAKGSDLTPLFSEMAALHASNAVAIRTYLISVGEKPDDSGSFMSTIHRTIIGIRALLTGLDASILPGLIDGEERILGYYDDALKTWSSPETFRTVLLEQRRTLEAKIADMKALANQRT